MQFRNLVFCLALISSVGPVPASAQAPAARPLFDEPDAAAAAPLAVADERRGPRVLRQRTARLNRARLADTLAAAGPGAALDLNLFADAAFRAEVERVEADAFGHRTWVGRVAGDPHSTVTLTWRDQIVVGSVQTAGVLFRIQGTMDAAVVDEVDPATFGAELEPVVAAEAHAEVANASPAADAPQDGEVADILVYYTTAAKNGQGGDAAIQALIATAVADANTAYARSGIVATLRLVGAVELPGYVESSTNMSADLNYLRGNAGVAGARDAAGADLVALIVNAAAGGACGIGYLGPSATYAHSVSSRTCIVGNYTFAHEVGHNLGSHHAPEDGATGAWKPYGYGYKDYTANFRTVMAYAPGTRILNFSDPAVLHNGRVTGSATQQNAQSLREAFSIVQGFRTAAGGGTLGAPRSLAAVVTGNSVSLSWLAPATGTPTGYVLQAGTAPGAANLFNGAVGATLSVGAPLPDGVYHARVFAQNAGGVGPASNEVTIVVGATAPPGAPGTLVGSVSGSTVSVSWAPPTSGGAATGYIAEVGTTPGAANVFNAAVGPITAASGALPLGTYYIRVRAQNAAGIGPVSNEVAVTVGPACTTPAAPVLSGGAAGGVVSLSWTTPAGGPTSGYTLQAGSVSGASNLFNAPIGLTNGLTAGVGPGTYYVRVLATASCGSGPASNQVVVTVP